MRLQSVDTHLVVALHALLQERSVTRAARRVGVTQPSMSHALSRLRAHFLVVRPCLLEARGYTLTLVWPERSEGDEGHSWLRAAIERAVACEPVAGPGEGGRGSAPDAQGELPR
ncbi:LysR family transcriptional regulator [Sorangium sp. KYC3313]|uniref:LysR family transcriptional regulator n=1 Tax=Sorangium sp. KYC3313 TaxID=3449740 RepID=UPI003F89149F